MADGRFIDAAGSNGSTRILARYRAMTGSGHGIRVVYQLDALVRLSKKGYYAGKFSL